MNRISVIIPYYQREPGILRRALDSVYAQDFAGHDVEVDVVIIDDESPSPPEIEVDSLNRDGFSIRILRRPNGGPSKARNTGLDAVTGADYVAFLDSDDLWRPAHLSTGLSLLKKGAQIYFCDSQYSETETWRGLPVLAWHPSAYRSCRLLHTGIERSRARNRPLPVSAGLEQSGMRETPVLCVEAAQKDQAPLL